MLLRCLIVPLVATAFAACGPSGTAPAAPQPSQPQQSEPSQPAEATACLATRVVPCQCKQGKGYRQCQSGVLGECVCQRADKPAAPVIAEDTSRDPSATPPDVKAPPLAAQRTPSGLAYVILKRGRGTTRPGPTTAVTVHYAGWTTDGKLFDSSYKRNRSARFPLNRVIKGWTEGLQLMVAGDKFRFWMPANLAYGNKPGKPMGMLVFDVELLSVH